MFLYHISSRPETLPERLTKMVNLYVNGSIRHISFYTKWKLMYLIQNGQHRFISRAQM